jgi:hypothetical protein
MTLWNRFTWWAWRRKRCERICLDILVCARMNPQNLCEKNHKQHDVVYKRGRVVGPIPDSTASAPVLEGLCI